MPDLHKNFAYSTVATAPSPATSGTSLVVAAADGAKFPAVPFNATIWPAGAQPTTTNAEIVRVTARSTDTLTITRSQESSSARTVIVGDQIAAGITAKTLEDSERHYPQAVGRDFVESGCVISADSVGVNKNYSITSGVVWIGGVRLTVAAVSAQTVAASKDRYVDLRNNGDGTAVYITNEVANNAASQALTAGDFRLGIVVAGATTIATTGSLNQGEEDRLLPIVSGVPYAVTDSIGNMIGLRDGLSKLYGYREIRSDQSTSSTTAVQIPGLECPVIIPSGGGKFEVEVHSGRVYTSGTNRAIVTGWDGAIGGTQISESWGVGVNGTFSAGMSESKREFTPSAGSHTFRGGLHSASAGTATFSGAATGPGYIRVMKV